MKTYPTPELPDFSLVLGGPLFHLFQRARLSGGTLGLWRRRIVVIAMLAWLPLLLLSLIEGHAFGTSVSIPFLLDIAAHVRFLVALPMLVMAELVVHRRISPLIRRFLETRIVTAPDLPAFCAAVRSALRARNSVAMELSLLVLAYTLGHWVWRTKLVLGTATWYAVPDATGLHLTYAGYWYAFASIPFFQFILFRWYVRLLIWFRLLWRISRLNLRLTAAHPDGAGGIGFLGRSSYAFAPILFAEGALLSGMIASRVLYEGQDLLSFKMDVVGLIAVMVSFMLGPLLMFTPMLDRAKRRSFGEYGRLANRYIFDFEEKWIHGADPETSELLGAADIQSLADLGNSYSVVSEMRLVPFGLSDLARLLMVTAAPFIPLALTIYSLEELFSRLVQVLL